MDLRSKTLFRTHNELAELPYFRINDAGRLNLNIDLGYGIIDFHTHLALAFGRRIRIDLLAEHACTHHYLPVEKPLDLNVYGNRAIPPEDVAALKRDLTWGSISDGGLRLTHTAKNLAREMTEMGVSQSVILPIELPVLSHNAENYLAAAKAMPSLTAFGSVHPLWRNPGQHLQEQKRLGAKGIKLHPAVQLFRPDGPRVTEIYRHAADLRLPILIHSGPVGIETRLGRFYTQMRHYEAAIRLDPRTTFVLGHSGALQMEQALELAQRYPNAWLELSSQGLGSVDKLLREAPKDRMVMGSDWPFYHQVVPISKLLIATERDHGLRRAVLRENAERLLGG